MESTSEEAAPLLQKSNSYESVSLPLDEQVPSNEITYFERPDTPIISTPLQRNTWQARSQRSHSSSLATLATEKKMSDPRRTFCLFVTFDFLITALLWLIECGASTSSQNSFFDNLTRQFKDYDVHTSLADVVLLAFCRFLFLEATYAIFRVRHWWPIAISTALSNAGLILKIFAVFTSVTSKHPLNVPMTVLVILSNFIVTWIEVWFMDFKVIPTEAKIKQKTVQAFLQQSYQGAPSVDNMLFSGPAMYGALSTSDRRSFYSPAATTAPSEGGLTGIESMYYSMHGYHKISPQWASRDAELVEAGKDALNKIWDLYHTSDNWKLEKSLANGDAVYTTETPESGKTFKIDAEIPELTPDLIYREIILKAAEMPLWNKNIADVKVLRRIGEQTFITIEISSPAAMGLISSREFITVRRIEKIGEFYVSVGVSTDQCDDIVPQSNLIRGINGPTGFIVGPGQKSAESSSFTWILNTDLRGNLNRSLVNKNLTSTLVGFVTAMKKHLQVIA